MHKTDPGFKERLSTVESAGQLGYCYQCSACVAECPSARHCEGFNPREIVLASLLGVAGYLTDKDSVLWQCATCYKCYERCPQGTHPIEVVTALKNIAFEKGNAPEGVVAVRDTVREAGVIIVASDTLAKRRAELGLQAAAAAPAADIKKLLE